MNRILRVGDQGETLGPLNPMGRISVNDEEVEARSEGEWIASDRKVLIVGGDTGRVVVREIKVREIHSDGSLAPDGNSHLKHGNPLPPQKHFEGTPLQSPPSRVEQIHFIKTGFGLGILILLIAWFVDLPIDGASILLPVSGAVSGWFARFFVGTAIESVGPREDHRPRARAIMLFLVLCSLAGSGVGLSLGMGMTGICLGITLGTLIGGIISYITLTLSFFL